MAEFSYCSSDNSLSSPHSAMSNQTSAHISADLYDLGGLGRLLTVAVPTVAELQQRGLTVSKKKPLVVALVDRSGSMSQWCSHVVNSARLFSDSSVVVSRLEPRLLFAQSLN